MSPISFIDPSWRRFARARQGVAAVEFAFIAPVAIALLVGLLTSGEAMMRYRLIAQTTQSVTWGAKALMTAPDADSYAVLGYASVEKLRNILLATQQVAAVPSTYQMSLRRMVNVNGVWKKKPFVVVDAAGVSHQVTEYDLGGHGLPPEDDVELSVAMKNGDALVVVQSSYAWPLGVGMRGASLTLTSRYSL